jgi:glycosyltransferase involved in cell wall biosynthesis
VKKINLILPSLKISGGGLEAIRLLEELNSIKANSSGLMCLWRTETPIILKNIDHTQISSLKTNAKFALFELPLLIAFFLVYLFKNNKKYSPLNRYWIFTHYSTVPFSFFVNKKRRFFFVQDIEWMFIRNAILKKLLKKFILFAYSKSTLLVANSYLANHLTSLGVKNIFLCPIWADKQFAVDSELKRNIDVVMVLRKGFHKRLDLYLDVISRLSIRYPDIKIAVISPEIEILEDIKSYVDFHFLNPSISEMASIYSRSKVFLHLSEHEGFGLPPLESMGAGCVPLCRDSGGVRAYMKDDFEKLLIPLDCGVEQISDRLLGLITDPNCLLNLSSAARDAFDNGLKQTFVRKSIFKEVFRL